MSPLTISDDVDRSLISGIRSARSLPSPPAVAARLIELAENPEATVSELVDTLHADAALTARVLRLANSPLYGRSQRAESLHHAVVMLGMDAVFTAALSLSVLSDRDSFAGSSFVVQQQWTRSVRAATASQILARRSGGVTPSDAFLGGLLQDIGVLVLLRLAPFVYRDLPAPFGHDDLVRCETEQLGIDHATVAGILLESWELPQRIADAVARSHEGGEVTHRLANVVAIGGLVADWIGGNADVLPAVVGAAEELLGLTPEELSGSLDELAAVLPELSQLFEATPLPTETLSEMAAEVLVTRQLRQSIDPARLRQELAGLTEVTRQLVAASRLDAVTGLVNRGHLDVVLDQEFERAVEHGSQLAVLFLDMDDFKVVNDQYGHQAGDVLLRTAAERVSRALRDGDIVGRYGGDEFLVVLPGVSDETAEVVAERVIAAFAETPFELPDGSIHAQTVTIGIGSLDHVSCAERAADLVRAADLALLDAKRGGKSAHSRSCAG